MHLKSDRDNFWHALFGFTFAVATPKTHLFLLQEHLPLPTSVLATYHSASAHNDPYNFDEQQLAAVKLRSGVGTGCCAQLRDWGDWEMELLIGLLVQQINLCAEHGGHSGDSM